MTTLLLSFYDPEYEQTVTLRSPGRMQTLVPGDAASVPLYRPSR